MNSPKLNLIEISQILSQVIQSFFHNENPVFLQFCKQLSNFIEKESRFPPILPKDSQHFTDILEDDLIYFIEHCPRFCLLESKKSSCRSVYNDAYSINCNFVNLYMAAGYLASEIQKLISRKYLPETRHVKIEDCTVNFI